MRADRRRPRRRPPWWPEDEPWPPSGSAGPWMWHGRRGWAGPRIGCFVIAFLLFVGLLGAFFLWAITTIIGALVGTPGGSVGVVALTAILILIAVTVMSFARRVTAPVGDLVDAAERIEAGDLRVRVRERGPRETRSLARAFNAMAERLQRTEEERRSFLADAAHELRTPLTVIRGRTEAMMDGVYPADPEHLSVILDETTTLERLVEDLRTVALLEAGALTLDREPSDPASLVADAAVAFRPQADEGGVDLVSSTPDGLPLADVDPVRVRAVIANLVANALRHTPRGGRITIGAASGPSGFVSFTVTDTGEGMAPDLAARAFDRFAKGAQSGGSGLGLAIARDLVRAHGGTIALESQQGRGTTVTFTVPVAA